MPDKPYPLSPYFLTWGEFEKWTNDLLSAVWEFRPDELIAIMRGGCTIAHYIARRLHLPVGAYWPRSASRASILQLALPASRKVFFIDDVIAEGRTYTEVNRHMRTHAPDLVWGYGALVSDASVDLFRYSPRPFIARICARWVVFPWEEGKHEIGNRTLLRLTDYQQHSRSVVRSQEEL